MKKFQVKYSIKTPRGIIPVKFQCTSKDLNYLADEVKSREYIILKTVEITEL
jgi:hypothetical protein